VKTTEARYVRIRDAARYLLRGWNVAAIQPRPTHVAHMLLTRPVPTWKLALEAVWRPWRWFSRRLWRWRWNREMKRWWEANNREGQARETR